MSADHYIYRVRWSAEDSAYIGTVAELPSLSWIDEDQMEAFAGIRSLASNVVEDMVAQGEVPPAALSDREFSGKFLIRVTPEVHRHLAIEATEQSVSLNRLVASKLAVA